MRGSANVTGLLLIAAFQMSCVDQPTQPSSHAPLATSSQSGRWGAVPEGAASAARPHSSSSATPRAASVAQFTNGSFETGNYDGWTLFEGELSTVPTNGTWGIATNGETIQPGQSIFDFFDGIDVQEMSPGLPHTYTATDGNFVALQLQNGPQTHRMYQDIALPASASTISWDMEYNNHFDFFVADAQEIIVDVRDVSTDAIVATLYRTTDRVSPPSIPMTHFTGDVSAFAGQTVRISVDMIVFRLYLDAAFDDFKVNLRVAASMADCKDAGWKSVFRANGSSFLNQGDCIQYVNTGK